MNGILARTLSFLNGIVAIVIIFVAALLCNMIAYVAFIKRHLAKIAGRSGRVHMMGDRVQRRQEPSLQ